jgi:hypothetical protein
VATGDSDDIAQRVVRTLPSRWFNQAAPIRDAIIGGAADLAAWLYGFLYFVYAQMRLATATGLSLDLIANDFLGLYLRRNGSNDSVFRAKIRATILQERVTRAGMVSMLKTLTGAEPIIFEPWNTGDAGSWDQGGAAWAGAAAGTQPGGGWNVASGWDINGSGYDITTSTYAASGGAGGWGSTNMPAQVLITVEPAAAQGVPLIGGWSAGPAAWDGGIGEWNDDATLDVGALTDADIYAAIVATKPTGVIAWTQLQ